MCLIARCADEVCFRFSRGQVYQQIAPEAMSLGGVRAAGLKTLSVRGRLSHAGTSSSVNYLMAI